MPKGANYTICWSHEQGKYLLRDVEKGEDSSLSDEGEDWLKWVGEHRAFAFHGRNGHLNMLKERRRGEGYWYAYQRHGREVVKRYVGRNEQVRMELLEEIASSLGNKDAVGRMDDGTVVEDKTTTSSMQFEPLLMPKLQLPRLQQSLLRRERLLRLLDRALECKLTVIAGPAGYGKTTLVNQWVAECSTQTDSPHIASVILDEGDNDPLRFWRYIIAACQGFREGVGKEALELLLAHRLPPFKPLHVMLTALLNELSQLEHASVLILDDFHAISSPQIIETLSFFVEYLPTSFHLVILIRGDPPFSLARLRARNEVLDIYPPQLAFSWEEAQAFFKRELTFPLAVKPLRQIYERMDGWPTGLRLLARDLRQTYSADDIERTLAAFAGSYWSIQDYFLNEVLYTLPTEQQEFLLQTSGLPLINASLCDVLMGRADSKQRIDALHGGDLFLIPLDGTGVWNRYHSLFAEAMQQEARRRLGNERLQLLAARASSWYEEHGHLAEAIETALNATDFMRSAQLIKQFIESKQQGLAPTIPEWYSIKRWVERLPEEDLERHPDLCVYYALSLLFAVMEGFYFPQGQERIEHLLRVAEEKWRDANNTMKLAEVFAFRALLARREGKILQAVTWAKQSLAWLPQEDRTWRNLDLTVVGIGEMLDGQLTRAYELLLEALKLSELQGNTIYARATRGMLSGVRLEQGELRHATEQLRQIQAEARVQEDRDDIAHTQLALAQIAYQWNNLQDAEQAALEALEIGKQVNEEEFQAHAIIRLAYIEHACGQSIQAEQRLMTWLACVQTPTSPFSYQLFHEAQLALAHIELVNGNLGAVEHWLAHSEGNQGILPLLQRQRKQLLQARLLLAQGEISTAIEWLEGLRAAARRTEHVLLQLEVQVVLALAYARQGLQIKAREQLHELLVLAQSEGYVRLFLDEGEEMATLLRGQLPYLHEKALLTYTRQLLNAFALEIGTSALEITSGAALLLEPLSQQEQKVLRLLAAGNANAEIARELVVSVNTVRTQIQSIYRKLNVNNRVEASSIARKLELI